MEKNVEKKLRLAIKAKGGLCLKWVSPGTTGVPDRIVILRDKILFVEVKFGRNGLSPQQRKVKSMMEALGHEVHVVNEDNLETFIYEKLDNSR